MSWQRQRGKEKKTVLNVVETKVHHLSGYSQPAGYGLYVTQTKPVAYSYAIIAWIISVRSRLEIGGGESGSGCHRNSDSDSVKMASLEQNCHEIHNLHDLLPHPPQEQHCPHTSLQVFSESHLKTAVHLGDDSIHHRLWEFVRLLELQSVYLLN